MSIKFNSPRDMVKQMRFAASRAVNDAAFDARQSLKDGLRQHFTIRNKWTERGFRVRKSRKGVQPTAIVGSTRQYLADQSLGATRTNTGIPGKRLRGKPNRAVRKRKWPRALLGKPRYFLATNRTRLPGKLRRSMRAGTRRVMRRMGRGGRELRTEWTLTRTQKIKRRYPFERLAERGFRSRLPMHMQRRLRQAAATAR